MAAETQLIMEELREIKLDLDYIKEHMVDVDTILTPEEEEHLEESLQQFRDRKTTSLTEFEKEMDENVQHRIG